MDIETIKKKYTKIIVWGCGKAFLNARTDDLEIAYIVDSDKNKQGGVCKGIRVEKPEKILEEDMEKICILIFSVYWQSIVKDINSLKISAEIILPGLLNPNPFSGGGQKAFSQYGEDAIIRGIQRKYRIDIRHYVDIGSNHPVKGNATYLFYLGGASGCLVEPNDSYLERIKLYRPRDMPLALGITGKESDGRDSKYYVIRGYDTRNTFCEELAKQYKEKGFDIYTKTIKLISLDSLLDKYNRRVDYLNIDVEGMEYEILKDFDFSKHDISIINVEKSGEMVKEIIVKNDYKLVAETPSNWIFVRG